MPDMRAKMRITNVGKDHPDGLTGYEVISFSAVGPNTQYPEDGSDENNTYARWTPSANLTMNIQNPALFDQFNVGDEFYVDFTKANS